VSVTACPLLPADNRSVRHVLLVYQTLQFDEGTTTLEFFTQHPPILHMGLCETALANSLSTLRLYRPTGR
jgi:hypothetical protein